MIDIFEFWTSWWEINSRAPPNFIVFGARVFVGSVPSESEKMLQNEVLDAKEFDETAENEAFEVLELG